MSSNPRDPRPGEIQMKNWVAQEAARQGVKPNTIYAWRRRYGAYPNLKLRRVDARLIYVTP